MFSCTPSAISPSELVSRVRPHLRLKLPVYAGTYGNDPRWSSKELDPVPVEQQTWGGLDYWSYWCSYLLASPLAATVSAVMSLGFTAREAIPIIFCGFLICSVVVILTGRIGATYHIPYPVLVRASFGMIGAYPAIVLRALVAMVWTSLLCVQGSGMLRNCLVALWPSFAEFPNHLPASAGIDSAGLLCFFLWWIVQTVLCLMPIQKLRLLFLAKAVVVPPAFFALFLWAAISTRGGGVLVTGPLKLTSMNTAYSTLTGINSIIALFSTMAVNMPAFGRFSKNHMSGAHQYLALPIIGTLGALTPIFVSSAHEMRYGSFEWSMAAVVARFESRVGKLVPSLCFMLATVGNQVAAGSSPFSNDVSSMMPRYINVSRGTLVMAIFCFASTPWKIIRTPSSFLSFLSAYSCITGPLAGLLLSDYYLVRRGKLDVHELYRPGGIYWYSHGMNWRAYAALLVAVAPLVPGVVGDVDERVRARLGGAWKVYTLAWPLSFVLAASTYWAICAWVSPPNESLVTVAVLPPHVGDDDALDLEMVTVAAPVIKGE